MTDVIKIREGAKIDKTEGSGVMNVEKQVTSKDIALC